MLIGGGEVPPSQHDCFAIQSEHAIAFLPHQLVLRNSIHGLVYEVTVCFSIKTSTEAENQG